MSQVSAATVVRRPRLRGSMHAVAAVVAVIAGVALTVRARDDLARVAAIVYGTGMTAMFGVSAAYHRGRWSDAARHRMKALDHTMIFCFIFGSYAALVTIVLDPRGRLVFLSSLAVVATAGAIVKVRYLDRAGSPADVFYGMTTWWGLWIVVPVVHALSPLDVALLLGGLLLYSLSGGVLAGRWWDPAPDTFGYHEVAHTVMVLGTIAHYAVYWRGYR